MDNIKVYKKEELLRALGGKFEIRRVRVVKVDYDDEPKNEAHYALVRTEAPEISDILEESCGFWENHDVRFADGSRLSLWPDNMNIEETRQRFSANDTISPYFTIASPEHLRHSPALERWLYHIGLTDRDLHECEDFVQVDRLYAYENITKMTPGSGGGVRYQQNASVYLRDSEIDSILAGVTDEDLRYRLMSILHSNRKTVASEAED